MTVALKAVLEQATRLSREERAELRDAFLQEKAWSDDGARLAGASTRK